MAWLDLLWTRSSCGAWSREADHVEAAELGPDSPPAGTTVEGPAEGSRPAGPGGLLRARCRARPQRVPLPASASPRRPGGLQAFGAHMFPLDALDAWPRLYGPAEAGPVPVGGTERAGARRWSTSSVALRDSAVPCYLAVLKDFGPANDAPLSFPLRGWTLALDLPGAAPGLPALLDRFDELVVEAGGRVYLAKDGRLRADVLAAMYPRLGQWRAVRDRVDPQGRWLSDLGLRTGMVATPR